MRRCAFPAISAALLLAFLTLQRLSELVVSKRNTGRLLARGGYEYGAPGYPVVIGFHVLWLASLWYFAWGRTVRVEFVLLAVVLAVGRFWVQRTLADRWTTRIIMLPGAVPVTSGPYRLVRHPNYLIVALELPCLSLAFGLVWHAVIFGAVNLVVTGWRMRTEDAAFSGLRAAR